MLFLCTNVSGVVEIINPSVTNILGYSPDQILGQNISTIFSNISEDTSSNKDQESSDSNNIKDLSGNAEKVSNQLDLMKNGQSGLIFEGHFICITDDAKEMPCGITILGMSSQGHTLKSEESSQEHLKVTSFVFILRDETQLIEQQKEAEASKAQSENLLFQILPRHIVTKLNSGEKDVSFTVQSASIIFTDVVKFSEYASGLSPQEIMESLSIMFAAFDSSAKKYDLITKIKLIGDIYMAAGGLFSDDEVPAKSHAEQVLNFGVDCLNELEDVNIKLNANLQLRVGINTSGPILAGVLGTDKPVFDIIGDPINIAARLQTTDIPGKIQIAKSTYELISEEDFEIEERGEVYLKGKGKTTSYLVSPLRNINALVSASSSIPII